MMTRPTWESLPRRVTWLTDKVALKVPSTPPAFACAARGADENTQLFLFG